MLKYFVFWLFLKKATGGGYLFLSHLNHYKAFCLVMDMQYIERVWKPVISVHLHPTDLSLLQKKK